MASKTLPSVWFLLQLKGQEEQVLCVKPQADAVLGDNALARMLDTLSKVLDSSTECPPMSNSTL